MSGAQTPQDYIETIQKEGIKSYVEYDVSEREVARYEAPKWLVVGNNCIVTYTGYWTTTYRVKGTVEDVAVWTQDMEDATIGIIPS